ncbi:hypothetical protein JCM10207_009026 [Rhodosporidiobolus poonsookiae]
MGGDGLSYIINPEQALYCANPDSFAGCVKLCPAADVVSIGVRIGSYLQALAYFLLVLCAPDEGGAESMWLGLSVSFSFLLACYVQLYLATITMHHVVVVTLLSHLPYIATLAGMNSLTSYEVLGPAGVRYLQGGMLIKSLFTGILWAFCLYALYAGQLPEWWHLQFRQVNCFDSTSVVVWFFPVKRTEASDPMNVFLIVSYTVFWFLVLAAGSYWTLIAPSVLKKRGGHLRDPKKKKIKGFNNTAQPLQPTGAAPPPYTDDDTDNSVEAISRRRKHMADDPYDYQRNEEDDDALALSTFRSLSKQPAAIPSTSAPSALPLPPSSAPASSSDPDNLAGMQTPRSLSPPPATEGMTAVAPWSKGLRGTSAEAAERWTRRQVESRHHFIIWPIVALLLVFTTLTIELQMAMNDVFEGETHLDFPGALTLFLALPTVWAVIKAVKRIQEGRRPTPGERADKTFLEVAKSEEQRLASRLHRRRQRERERQQSRVRAQSAHKYAQAAGDYSDSELSDDGASGRGGGRYRAVGKRQARRGSRSAGEYV